MIKEKLIDGGKLFVARVRVVLDDDKITGDRRTAHYNTLGYRLFIQKNENNYIDVLSGKVFPVINERLKEHDLFIVEPKPFWVYANSLRIKEKSEHVKEYAEFVAIYFNKFKHDTKKFKDAKKFVHEVHHQNEENTLI